MQHDRRRNQPRPQATRIGNLEKLGCVVSQICPRRLTKTHKHAAHNRRCMLTQSFNKAFCVSSSFSQFMYFVSVMNHVVLIDH